MPMAVSYTVIDGEIVSETRGGVSKAYAPDSLGSTIALYDASGNITDTWEYWPYGEVRTRTGTTPTPFQYVGTLGYYTDATGNLYVRARSYQPKTTRWMSVDLLWPRQSAFKYCATNPASTEDRFGTDPPIPRWPGPEPSGQNYGPCGVYVCQEHSLGWPISGIASHQYVCVAGPYGGCAGGLYPDTTFIGFGTGKVGNKLGSCPIGDSAIGVTCELYASECSLAIQVCECVKEARKSPGLYLFAIRDCYGFPKEMILCGCNKYKDANKRSRCVLRFVNI